MSNAIIVTHDVEKVYRDGGRAREVRAVDGISVEIARGETVAIVGPSGAGKSTLLHLIAGLDTPTRGEIIVDGVDIAKLSSGEKAWTRNAKIGLVFQFYHLLPEFNCIENVMLPALMKRQISYMTTRRETRGEIRARAAGLLGLVGLSERLDHRPGELSGGESQRVAIARALVNDPSILVCDEPTGNLDSGTSKAVYDLIFNICREKNMTLLVVTHDMSVTSRFSRTITLRDGKLAI